MEIMNLKANISAMMPVNHHELRIYLPGNCFLLVSFQQSCYIVLCALLSC